jgi:hypothetical protein
MATGENMPIKRTIIAAGEGARYEYTADAAVTPGDLITPTPTGCVRNATADFKAPALFAIEDEIFGRGVNTGSGYAALNNGVDYAAGDRVIAEMCSNGMMVNANLAAGAAAILKGDPITAGALGTVKKGTTANQFALADEPVDNSASALPTRFRILIIS